MTDLFVEDGTTISGFAFLCTSAALWAAIEEYGHARAMLELADCGVSRNDFARALERERAPRARVCELLGMDDAEASELGPDSTG